MLTVNAKNVLHDLLNHSVDPIIGTNYDGITVFIHLRRFVRLDTL
jgi:hypothetical protein